MYGFFVTDIGRDRIAQTFDTGSKITINQFALGDAGDPMADYEYGIESLHNQVYSKPLGNLDSYSVKGNKLMIKAVIPETAGEITFNEVGFLDDTGVLIIYGVIGTVHKLAGTDEAPQVVELENYIQLDQAQLDHVVIAVDDYSVRLDTIEALAENINDRVKTLEGSGGSSLVARVNALEEKDRDLEPRVKALEDTLEGLNELLESIA